MSADEMADAIAWFLDGEEGWAAAFDGLGDIKFTNEGGDRFILTVVADEDA